jgi:hypothetical protein
MSETKPTLPYTRASHPHTDDPRVDAQAGIDNAQLTLDKLIAAQSTLVERRRLEIVKRKGRIETIKKGEKGERLFLDEGTRDALPPFDGRVYTPEEGVVIRNLPPEKRDSTIVLKTSKGQIFFAVNGREIMDNSVPYFEGFVLQQEGNKGDLLTVMALGYAKKWDIQGNNNAAD